MPDISEHFWATEASLELELDLRSSLFVHRSALMNGRAELFDRNFLFNSFPPNSREPRQEHKRNKK